jgi:hypothetical protein
MPSWAEKDTDPPEIVINLINESLRSSLLAVAFKLLSSEPWRFEDLTISEQKLWHSFQNSKIYKFLT